MPFVQQFLMDFYPRPPRGGRRLSSGQLGLGRMISIHALREEGDRPGGYFRPAEGEFLSTPSARRATKPFCFYGILFTISIHALREEGDISFFIR